MSAAVRAELDTQGARLATIEKSLVVLVDAVTKNAGAKNSNFQARKKKRRSHLRTRPRTPARAAGQEATRRRRRLVVADPSGKNSKDGVAAKKGAKAAKGHQEDSDGDGDLRKMQLVHVYDWVDQSKKGLEEILEGINIPLGEPSKECLMSFATLLATHSFSTDEAADERRE